MNRELLERVELIQGMLAEGRRGTQYYGWVFLLWGVGQLAAILWGSVSRNDGLAWGVTMSVCAVITAIGTAASRRREGKVTTVGRALAAIWMAAGISLFLLGFAGGASQVFQPSAILALALVLQGMPNFASGMILRWRVQVAVAVIWWVAGAAAMFLKAQAAAWTYMVAVMIGSVLFGLYLIFRQRKDAKRA